MYQESLYLKPNQHMCLFTSSKDLEIGQLSQEISVVSKLASSMNHPVFPCRHHIYMPSNLALPSIHSSATLAEYLGQRAPQPPVPRQLRAHHQVHPPLLPPKEPLRAVPPLRQPLLPFHRPPQLGWLLRVVSTAITTSSTSFQNKIKMSCRGGFVKGFLKVLHGKLDNT